MVKPKRVEALKHKLEELKGISNALWESWNHRVGTLELKMNVHDSRSSKAPQSNERIIVMQETRKQLGDTIKALDKVVKDSIVNLQT